MTINAVVTGLCWIMKADLSTLKLIELRESYSYIHPFDDTSFETYIELDDRIGLPYGNQTKLKTLLPNLIIDDQRIAPKMNHTVNLTGLILMGYQEDALIEILEYFSSGGTTFNLAGKPGSGKSVLIAAILAEMGIKTLIIAHLSMLTTQLAGELSQFTDANASVLNAKNMELKDVNIATSQFISKRPELWKKLKHEIGCIIIDESETVGSLTTMRILQRAHAKYRIFVSATFTRSVDRRTQALKDVAGHKVVTLNRPDLIIPTIMMVRCEEWYPAFSGKNRFVKDKHSFFLQESIMDKVLLIARKSLNKDRYILIATDIVTMQERIQKELGFGVLNGKTKKKDRDKILQDFNSGVLKGITGAAVLNAGLSIPRVSTIIRVSFTGSPEKNIQLVGRSLREFDGKEGSWFFDFVFVGQNPNKRIRAYKENGYTVTHHSWEKLKEKL